MHLLLLLIIIFLLLLLLLSLLHFFFHLFFCFVFLCAAGLVGLFCYVNNCLKLTET